MNAFKQSKDGESLPSFVFPYKRRNSVGWSGSSLEIKVNRKEGHVWERVLQRRLGNGKSEIAGFSNREPSLIVSAERR